MSRTYRHIRKAKYKRFEFESRYGHWTREELREDTTLYPYPFWWRRFKPHEKNVARRLDRHLAKDSLRHGSMQRYWRRKTYDDTGW